MTHQPAMPLDDARIERMLSIRAGSGRPAGLVADIMAAAAVTPQSRRWPGGSLPRLVRGTRVLLVAATLVLAVIATAVFVGSQRQNVTVPPAPPIPPVISPSTTPTPSPVPTPTPVPGSSPSASASASLPAIAPQPDHAPLIVYRRGASQVDLFTLDAFTGDRVGMGTLQRGAAVAGQHLEWAADRGSAFVYGDSDSVSARIDVADRSVAGLVGLGPSPNRDSVSPSGDMIARLADNSHLAIVDLNGDPITTIDLPDGLEPIIALHWSPDSSTVAISSCRPCDFSKSVRVPWHIFLAPIDGGPVRQVGDLDVDYVAIDDWSPDGTRLLLSDSSCPDVVCTGGLLVLDTATGEATRLTSTGERASRFSSDGSHVVSIDGLFGTRISVMAVDAGPGAARDIVTVPDGAEFGFDDPRWSPNGDWILYRRVPVIDGQQTGIGDLWVVPSAGGEPRQVIKNAIADW